LPRSGQQISAKSGGGHPLSGSRETCVIPNVHLATVLPPHAPRPTLVQKSGRDHPLSGTPGTWLAPNVRAPNVPMPHASRPMPPPAGPSGVRSCAGPSPLATAIHRQPNWQRPNGAQSRRAAPLYSVCHQTGRSFRTDQIFVPRSPMYNR